LALKVDPGRVSLSPESETNAEDHARDLENREHGQILTHRDRFAEIAYGIMQAWVGFLIVLVTAQFSLKPLNMGLTQGEFIAVVTTTTAAVFGFGVVVGNFLFPKGGSARRRV
jgi:hypothetical protein